MAASATRRNLRLWLVPGFLAALGTPCVAQTLSDVVQQVRVLERSADRLRFSFVGDQTNDLPTPVPSLKSNRPVLRAVATSHHYEGTFAKFGRAYLFRYRCDAEKAITVQQSDGKVSISYKEGQPTDLNGLDGTIINEAGHSSFRLFENLGCFFPNSEPWITTDLLSSHLKGGKVAGVTRDSEGLVTVSLSGLSAPFEITYNPKVQGEIRRFGFRFAKKGAEMYRIWTSSGYAWVDGVRLPTVIDRNGEYSEYGTEVTGSHERWTLTNITTHVTKASVLKPIPKGFVMQTIAGLKGGRVLSDGQTVKPVPLDYGTPEYWQGRSMRTLFFVVCGVLLIAIAIAAILRRTHSRNRP